MTDDKTLLTLVKTHIDDDREVHKSYLALLNNISNQTKETHECVNKLDKKLDLSIQKIEFQIKEINALDRRQNQLIDEHIEGVNTLKQMYSLQKEEYDNRFSNLEEPSKFRSKLKKMIVNIFIPITLLISLLVNLSKLNWWPFN